MMAEFIYKVIELAPWAEYGYFKREKHNNRVQIFPKRKWLKIADRAIRRRK